MAAKGGIAPSENAGKECRFVAAAEKPDLKANPWSAPAPMDPRLNFLYSTDHQMKGRRESLGRWILNL